MDNGIPTKPRALQEAHFTLKTKFDKEKGIITFSIVTPKPTDLPVVTISIRESLFYKDPIDSSQDLIISRETHFFNDDTQ
jgi:hypothetical protein